MQPPGARGSGVVMEVATLERLEVNFVGSLGLGQVHGLNRAGILIIG